jgi:signal transduction histidine kinase
VLSLSITLFRSLRIRAVRVPHRTDLLVTAGALVAVIVPYLLPDTELRWGAGRFLLESGSCLPLIWRRRHPITVCLASGEITLWITATVHPAQPFPIAVLICNYTIGSELSGRARIVMGSLFMAGNAAAEFLHRQWGNGPDFYVSYITSGSALLLGILMQTQRKYAAAMEVRAREVEQSRAVDVERAAAAERARIARDMHDVVGHAVALMIVQAEAGPLMVRTRPDKAEAAFDAIADVGRDAMTQLRRLLGVLKQEDGTGGTRAPQPTIADIEELVEQVRRGGLAVTLVQSGEAVALPPDSEVAAYRVVQEALTNTMKHAAASRAEVLLEWLDRALTITVTDDGRGAPDAPGSVHPGHGLIGLRERLASCGGSLSVRAVRPGPGAPHGLPGFAIAAHIPAA